MTITTYHEYKSETLYSSRYQGTDTSEYLRNHCMYCRTRLERSNNSRNVTYHSRDESTGTITSASATNFDSTLLRCPRCSWWLVLISDFERDLTGKKRYQVEHAWGMLKRYDVNQLNLPLSELRTYIDQRPETVWKLDYRQFGRLMNDCFKNSLDCYVEYLDGPYDRGVDARLYLVESEPTSYLVQYKARQSPRPAEGVAVVRDLVGAMVDNEMQRGIIVTTREKWSYEAIAMANRGSLRRQGFYVDLYDSSRVLELVRQLRSEDAEPWVQLFDPLVLRPDFLKQVADDEKRWRKKS